MKSSKKALAFALAAAMAITGVPVTNAGAATTTAKLGATKATIYAGSSKYISVSTPSSWKSVKLSVSSSKTSVASVKKNNAEKKIKVTAVKAGTAKVTVKVTAKKSGKTVKKTLSANITVKDYKVRLVDAAGKTVSNTTIDTTVGTAVKLTAKTAPANDKVTFTSDNESVATVDASGNVTPVKAGTVTITAASAKATDKVTINVSEAAKEGVTATLTNPISADYPDTVMVNDTALINVSCVQDGKPVSGETVVIGITGGTDAFADYWTGLNNTAVTNSNGVATFVIRNYSTNLKASDYTEIASVNYKVQVPASSITTEGTVKFAAIRNAAITNVNNHNAPTSDDLVPSTNYTDATRKGLAITASMDAPTIDEDEYVESQQVSSTGAKEHEVTMTGGYPVIYLPGSSTTVENATKMVDEINYTSPKYNTYANDSYYYELKEDPNKLTYATLNFSKATLSKYTRLVVETFKDKATAEANKQPGVAGNGSLDQKIYDGEMSQSDFNYQIPLGSGYAKLCVKVTIQSAGQVDMAKNEGYTAKDVVYVYKTQTSSAGTTVPLKNATVEWQIAATPYTAEATVANVNGVPVASGETLTAKLPAFPYTGTAVITKYDSNGKVVAYYAVATHNNGKNQNVIDPVAVAYQISSDELRDKVGEITSQNGTSVTVDSKQSGRMTLEGTVKVNGKVLDDAELANVYTSVQWNPIPQTTTTTTSDAFVALIGQKIEVVAQLTDKNGNAVSLSGYGINFKDSTKTYGSSDKSISGKKGTATIVNTLTSKTDANGQAKMTLKASAVAELLNIKAESADSKYNAKLIIAGQSTNNADLYWIDANLSFTDKVQAGAKKVVTSTIDQAKTTASESLDIQPDAGTAWMYGVQTEGTSISYGKLAGKSVTINGLGITMSKTSSSVGTVEAIADVKGAVKATSTKGGPMNIVSKIDSSTLTKDVTVSEGTFAGTGATSINKKLTINVTWKAAGLTASYVNPTGTRTTATSKDVYLKVTDAYGNAVPDKNVTFKADDGTVTASDTTDANGIAKATLNKGTGSTSTVSATVAGISSETFDQTIVWVNASDITNLAIDSNKNQVEDTFLTNYDKDKKTVTLTFNDDVVASSVVKEMFEVKYNAFGETSKQLVVKSVAVDNNVVTLTLSDVPSLVDARDTVVVGITNGTTVKSVAYSLTSVAGSTYSKTSVTIKLDGSTAPTEG